MKRLNKHIKENRGALLILLIVSLVLILPPIIHQYPYPNLSDDTPRYLAGIERMIDGQPYYEDFGTYQVYRYPAPALTGLVIKALHTDPYWTFYIFHYLALIAISISVWFFCTKLFNKLVGYIGLVAVVLCTPSFMQFFLDGAIFNLINLLIFGLMGILALIYWLRTNRPYYAVISMMLLTISILYHSSTGLEIFFGVLAFLTMYIVWDVLHKKRQTFIRVMPYLMIYGIIGTVLIITICPESDTLIKLSSNIGVKEGATSVSIYSFVLQKSSLMVLLFTILATLYIFKSRCIKCIEHKLGLGLMLSWCVVVVGTIFIKNGNPDRSAQDASIIVALLGSSLIGLALYDMRNRFSRSIKKLGILLLIVAAIPVMYHYYGYNSAVRGVDLQAIELLNSLDGQTYFGSTQLESSIYGLFTDKVYIKDGEYIIYRSLPMSGKTNPNHPYTEVVGNASTEEDFKGLPILGSFYDSTVKVVVYGKE